MKHQHRLPVYAAASGKRLQELDALRGIAALAVLFFHYTVGYNHVIHPEAPKHYALFWYGSMGVHLFFIISGFVILMTLERSKTLIEFAILRAARLMPAYYVCSGLTLILIMVAQFNPVHITISDIVFNVTIMSEYFGAGSIDPSYWSLAYEIFFYLTAALAFFVLRIRRFEIACPVWLGLSAIEQVLPIPLRIETFLNFHFSFLFVSGMMLYLIYCSRWTWLTLVTLAAAFLQGFFIERPSWAAVCGIFMLIVWLASTNRLAILRTPALVFLGGISYALYLLHQIIGYWIMQRFEQAGAPVEFGAPVATAVAIGMAAAVRYTVEVPAQRAIRHRYHIWLSRNIHSVRVAG